VVQLSGLGTLIPAVNEYSNLSYDWPQSEWYADYSATGSTPFLTNDPNFTLSGIMLTQQAPLLKKYMIMIGKPYQ
jgi:hypothetical protein